MVKAVPTPSATCSTTPSFSTRWNTLRIVDPPHASGSDLHRASSRGYPLQVCSWSALITGRRFTYKPHRSARTRCRRGATQVDVKATAPQSVPTSRAPDTRRDPQRARKPYNPYHTTFSYHWQEPFLEQVESAKARPCEREVVGRFRTSGSFPSGTGPSIEINSFSHGRYSERLRRRTSCFLWKSVTVRSM